MTDFIQKTQSAYSYPLLIKNLLFSPVADNPDREICLELDCAYIFAAVCESTAFQADLHRQRRCCALTSVPDV